VVTYAINQHISGISVSGSKPFAAFSGTMAGFDQYRNSEEYSGLPDYTMVMLFFN
jgi:hypothetical protein